MVKDLTATGAKLARLSQFGLACPGPACRYLVDLVDLVDVVTWYQEYIRTRIQCIQFFFSKTLFDFKKSISGLMSSNVQERLLMKYFMPQFIFGVSIFSLRALFQFLG